MRVISINLNGIRAAAQKGFFTWAQSVSPDIICCQEIKAHGEHLEAVALNLEDYHTYFLPAAKKGYSGVGIYSKQQPQAVYMDHLFEEEGRYIEAHFNDLIIASVYLPSGTSGPERQEVKYLVLDKFWQTLSQAINSGKKFIVCGDLNIAHQKIDLKNWRGNQKNSGFLPEERAWLDKVFYELKFIDTYRYLHPTGEEYTWWSYRGNAYNKNVGWRIDYQITTPNLATHILNSSVYTEQRFSDHAPLIVDYDLRLKA